MSRSIAYLIGFSVLVWSCSGGERASDDDPTSGGTAGTTGGSGGGSRGGASSGVGGSSNGMTGSGGAAGEGGTPAAGGTAGTGADGGTGSGADGGTGGFDPRDLFDDQPGSIELSGSITKTDNICVVIYSGGMCLAQNDPPCTYGSSPQNVTLTLTLDAQDNLTVEAPYQDMCTSDYVGAVVDAGGTPIGGAVATSYAVPFDTTAYYAPRSIDYCRVDSNGIDTIVEDEISTYVDGTDLIIAQSCTTKFTVIDPIYETPVTLTDTRNWTTVVPLQ